MKSRTRVVMVLSAALVSSCTQQFPLPGGGSGKVSVGTFKETPIEEGGRPGVFIEREILPVDAVRADK